MNHYTWTFVAGEGKNYPVGLFHGTKTGHLLIYVSGKIMTIDFKVFGSKSYSFFIQDELCRIRLERKGDEMFYFFETDRQADTPLNHYRKKMERKYTRQMVIFILAFAALVTGFVFLSKNFKKRQTPDAAMFAYLLRETSGQVVIKPGSPSPEIFYQFVANNSPFSSKIAAQPQPPILLNNGMPLESGDEFTVTYLSTTPDSSRMDFDRPTERQLERYRQRAQEKYAASHPGEAAGTIACMVKIAFEMEGIGGLADFYFLDVPPAKNADHNEHTFLRLTRDLPFQKKVKEDCF